MKKDDIIKNWNRINKVKDPMARSLELTLVAKEIADTVSPAFAEMLMYRYPEIIELLELIWLEGMLRKLRAKKIAIVTPILSA